MAVLARQEKHSPSGGGNDSQSPKPVGLRTLDEVTKLTSGRHTQATCEC